MVKVLVTGAFGNVGESAMIEMLEQGLQVRAFDLPTRRNRRLARRYGERIETAWGDLRRPEDVARAVQGVDAVAHIAFIIPPLSEERPEWARLINVGGTENLVRAMQNQAQPPRMVFCSSVAVHGERSLDDIPPLNPDDPLEAIDHYAEHKIACEALIRESGLAWVILRLGAVPPLRMAWKPDPIMFRFPLGQREEMVHTRDVGLAIANACTREEAAGRTLMIGGGPGCQITHRDLMRGLLGVMGLPMLSERAFSPDPFYLDWMDTQDSQRILGFQRYTFSDYLAQMRRNVPEALRRLARPVAPLVRCILNRRSPYWRRIKDME